MASIVSSSSSSRRAPTLAEQQENERWHKEWAKLENLKSTDSEISKVQNTGYLLHFLAFVSFILIFVMIIMGLNGSIDANISYAMAGVSAILGIYLVMKGFEKHRKADDMAEKKLYS